MSFKKITLSVATCAAAASLGAASQTTKAVTWFLERIPNEFW